MPTDPAQLIEFLYAPGPDFPPPLPAAKAIPEWLKMLPAEVPAAGMGFGTIGSVKACPPFVEAMTCGYVLPVICDVHFFLRAPGSLEFQQTLPVIQSHPHAQYSGSPFSDKLVVKIVNPWIVKTPPGYSTIFLPLLNQFSLPFQVLAGLVETDTFYRPVFFPTLCHLAPGQRFTLAKGTPIVQAIPFKRDAWESKVAPADATRSDAALDALNANIHMYKQQSWVKKDFH